MKATDWKGTSLLPLLAVVCAEPHISLAQTLREWAQKYRSDVRRRIAKDLQERLDTRQATLAANRTDRLLLTASSLVASSDGAARHQW